MNLASLGLNFGIHFVAGLVIAAVMVVWVKAGIRNRGHRRIDTFRHVEQPKSLPCLFHPETMRAYPTIIEPRHLEKVLAQRAKMEEEKRLAIHGMEVGG